MVWWPGALPLVWFLQNDRHPSIAGRLKAWKTNYKPQNSNMDLKPFFLSKYDKVVVFVFFLLNCTCSLLGFDVFCEIFWGGSPSDMATLGSLGVPGPWQPSGRRLLLESVAIGVVLGTCRAQLPSAAELDPASSGLPAINSWATSGKIRAPGLGWSSPKREPHPLGPSWVLGRGWNRRKIVNGHGHFRNRFIGSTYHMSGLCKGM